MLPDYHRIKSEFAEAAAMIATIMAHGMGNPGTDKATLRNDAMHLLVRWLATTDLNIDIGKALVDLPAKKKDNEKKEFQGENEKKDSVAKGATRTWQNYFEEWTTSRGPLLEHKKKLSAVLLPLDGATSLSEGRAGSMCWLAAGEHSAFDEFSRLAGGTTPADKSYFVLVLGPSAALWKSRSLLRSLGETEAVKSDTPLQAFMASNPHLLSVIPTDNLLVAHTMELDQFRHTHPALGRCTLGRRLDGSTVVSAVAALTGRTDLGYCVCRLPALALIAAASHIMGGAVLALPVEIAESAVVVRGGTKFLVGEKLYSKKADLLVVGASMTEICISDRIRWNALPWRCSDHSEPSQKCTDGGPFMSVHSVVLDSRLPIYEERSMTWDVSRVRCFGNSSLRSEIDTHTEKWKKMYNKEIEKVKVNTPTNGLVVTSIKQSQQTREISNG